jgi:hypothetical protein
MSGSPATSGLLPSLFAGVVIAVGLYVVACGVAQLFATG